MYNLIRLYGYEDLYEQFNVENAIKCLNEVNNRISIINLKNGIDSSEDMSQVLNMALDQIDFEEGTQIRQDTMERIKQAMLIIERGDYVRPRYDSYKGRHNVLYRDEFQSKVHIYMESLKKIVTRGI